MKKKNWVQKLGTMLGVSIAAVILSQSAVVAQEIISTENTTFQIGADKTATADFSAGPIMPGDTLKVQRKYHFRRNRIHSADRCYGCCCLLVLSQGL